MIFADGYEMDKNLRVLCCPKCNNEQFSDNAEFCRICGTPLFNYCEGEDVCDEMGNIDRIRHKNYGNSRFCEKCGTKTVFFTKKFLQVFDELPRDSLEAFSEQGVIGKGNIVSASVEIGSDDLPF